MADREASESKLQSSHNHRAKCNHFVEKYHRMIMKTLTPATKEIIDDLLFIRTRTAGVIEQTPDYGDLDVLTALLGIISELAMVIDWDSLNKPYYWEDFTYESKVIIDKIPKLKKKMISIYEKAKKLCMLSDSIFSYVEPLKDIPGDHNDFVKAIQTRHTPPMGINVRWNNFTHEIQTVYQNLDGSFADETIKCTTDRIRIRILRYIMNYTRVIIESNYVTMEKLDAALDKDIPVNDLQKCDGIKENTLTPLEYAKILEAKTQLDKDLVEIYNSASILKYHYSSHKAFTNVLKKIKPNKRMEHAKNFIKLSICVDDNRLINYWLQQVKNVDGNEQEEDPLPVILQDRSDDTLDIIADMMNFSTGCFKKMEAIIFLLKRCEWNVFDETALTTKTKGDPKIKIALSGIKGNIKPLREFLQKCTKCLKNEKMFQHFCPDLLQMKEFIENRNIDTDELWCIRHFQGADHPLWISLTNEHRISFVGENITIKNENDETMYFQELIMTEKVQVVMKLIENLGKIFSYGKFFIKYGYERVKYTAILAKRLTKTDQTGQVLANHVQSGINELNLLDELTQVIESMEKLIV